MARRTAVPAPAPGRPVRVRSLPVLEAAADAVQARSVPDPRPWRTRLHADRLEFLADRTGPPTAPGPTPRALTQGIGAALLDARVALAAAGTAVRVDRLPDPAEPALLAVVRPVDGPPDAALAGLAPAVRRRRTDGRRSGPDVLPEAVLRVLVAAAAAEDTVLVPVTREDHVQLLARLTDQAARVQGTASGQLPAGTGPVTARTLLLLATHRDDPLAWLRCGEAVERVLLELAARSRVAGPLPHAVEVPVTRTQLRSALTWDAHPQSVLRVGRPPAPCPPPGGRPAEVVADDGHGGTTWR
ncbi:hypothetical protein ACI780_10520 [Geodermatophilus sp. SYSU D00814]